MHGILLLIFPVKSKRFQNISYCKVQIDLTKYFPIFRFMLWYEFARLDSKHCTYNWIVLLPFSQISCDGRKLFDYFYSFLSFPQFMFFEASNKAIVCIHEKNAHYRKLSRQIKAIFFLFDQITSTWFKANTTAFNISLCICNVCFFSSSLF